MGISQITPPFGEISSSLLNKNSFALSYYFLRNHYMSNYNFKISSHYHLEVKVPMPVMILK
ncbi:MAG: hypothetical protein A2006_12115 [Ignavibacteria bacterium GWC2_35_8]|nr:MAG: hypothetical protein A2006_12115 [Ignavibacteria bacterium GWC2_35_8]